MNVTSLKSFLFFSLIAAMILPFGSLAFADVPTPLTQLKSGVEPHDIQCNEGKVLVERSNGKVACVSNITSERMGWEIIPVSNIEQSNPSNKLNNNFIPSSSFPSSKLSFFDAVITIEKAPLLDETVNFDVTFTPTKHTTDNVDNILQSLNSNNAIPQNTYYTLEFSNSLDVKIDGINMSDIIMEKKQYKSTRTTYDIPRETDLTREFILSSFTIKGTLTPTVQGDYTIFAYLGDSYTNSIYFHSGEYESFVTKTSPHRMILPDPSSIPLTKFDESKRAELDNLYESVSVADEAFSISNDTQSLDYLEEQYQIANQFWELNQVDKDYSDMPNHPQMIVKMPKATNFDVDFDIPSKVNLGDLFNVEITIKSNDSNNYEQIIYDIYVESGLQVTSEKDIKLFDDLVQDYIHLQRVIEEGDFTPNVSLKQLFSLEPQEKEITHTHLVKALESGDWMIKAIVNDVVIKKTVMVN